MASFSDPLFSDYNVILTRSEHPYISDMKALVNESLALGENSALYERLSHDFPNLTIFSVETPEDAIFLVLNNKIDMTIRSSTIMSYTIRKQGLLNLKISAILDDYKNIFKIGIVGNNELLRGILNKGIENLSASEKEAIVNTYNPIIFDKKLDKSAWYVLIAIFLVLCLFYYGITPYENKSKKLTLLILPIKKSWYNKLNKLNLDNWSVIFRISGVNPCPIWAVLI